MFRSVFVAIAIACAPTELAWGLGVGKCANQQNSWWNNDNGSTGACISTDGSTYAYHCPWQSSWLQNQNHCDESKIKYDCEDTTNLNRLIVFYQRQMGKQQTYDGTMKDTEATVNCIRKQCPANGPAVSTLRRLEIV